MSGFNKYAEGVRKMGTKSTKGTKGTFADVHCKGCGMPAKYNIVKHSYLCEYCGREVTVNEALKEKEGFRKLRQAEIKKSRKEYKLYSAACTGCGAEIVFDEDEAMANCAFCGRTLVRKNYTRDTQLPELIIPFRITLQEAKEELLKWCDENKRHKESRHVRERIDQLQGFYLPYELIRGPVESTASRMDAASIFHARGYVDNVFVSCSSQLSNYVLDGMEPYELDELEEFDFSYVAGQRVKIGDLDSEGLEWRVRGEIADDYTPIVQKTLETKAVTVVTTVDEVMQMPVLLPAYYIQDGDTKVAINGQTGNISVAEERIRHLIFFPWWFKAILATIIATAVLYGAFWFFGAEKDLRIVGTACFAGIIGIVSLAAYSDSERNSFVVDDGYRLLKSKGGPLRRDENRKLYKDPVEIKEEVTPPVCFMNIEGEEKKVKIVFTSFARVTRMILMSVGALFAPAILALFINGFNIFKLDLRGSAAWFCLAVPLVPVFIIKYARVDLYNNPWIYILDDKGGKKKYVDKQLKSDIKELAKDAFKAMFTWPICLLIWFGILCFIAQVYLTAFGLD